MKIISNGIHFKTFKQVYFISNSNSKFHTKNKHKTSQDNFAKEEAKKSDSIYMIRIYDS